MLSVYSKDGVDAVGLCFHGYDGQCLEHGLMRVQVVEAIVHGEQPDVALAIGFHVSDIDGLMVVYRLVISDPSLDVVGFYDSESTSGAGPDGMRDGILYKIVVDDEVLVTFIKVY